jgi:hypothetical protein
MGVTPMNIAVEGKRTVIPFRAPVEKDQDATTPKKHVTCAEIGAEDATKLNKETQGKSVAELKDGK